MISSFIITKNKSKNRKLMILFLIFGLGCVPPKPSPTVSKITTPFPSTFQTGEHYTKLLEFSFISEAPCIGDTLTLIVKNLENKNETNVVVWVTPNFVRSDGGKGVPEAFLPDAVNVGTTSIKNGEISFSFQLKEQLSPSRSGGSLQIKAGNKYNGYIQINNEYQGAFSFTVCSK